MITCKANAQRFRESIRWKPDEKLSKLIYVAIYGTKIMKNELLLSFWRDGIFPVDFSGLFDLIKDHQDFKLNC